MTAGGRDDGAVPAAAQVGKMAYNCRRNPMTARRPPLLPAPRHSSESEPDRNWNPITNRNRASELEPDPKSEFKPQTEAAKRKEHHNGR